MACGVYPCSYCVTLSFFFQAEDGIRDYKVTGVQTCALPICWIDEPQDALRVEREYRHIDLLYDSREECGGLKRAPPLGLEGVSQAVDLGKDVAQGVAPPGSPGAEREIPLAQRQQQVGHRLQGPHDAQPDRGREAEPAGEDNQADRRANLGRAALAPQPRDRDRDGRQSAQKAPDEYRLVMGELPRPFGHERTLATPAESYSPYFSRRR